VTSNSLNPGSNTDALHPELVLEHVFDAPRDLVWKAWTEPEHFMRWYGPNDYTTGVTELNAQEGGKLLAYMESMDGQKLWFTGTFLEVVPMVQLVYTDSFADEAGNIVPATHYGFENHPTVTEVTVMFEDEGDKTRVILKHTGLPEGEMRDGAYEGWSQAFDKLAAFLK
jgi:uncharacterized protein YndB with AHSA1/START domain